jgi:hypothetical protein
MEKNGMGRKHNMHLECKILIWKPIRRDYLEDLGIGEILILSLIIEKYSMKCSVD